MYYGEGETNPKVKNLRRQLVRAYDQAGLVSAKEYDFKGNVIKSSRRFAVAYATDPDWPLESGGSPGALLLTEGFTSTVVVDAMNRVTTGTTPDGTETSYGFDEGGRLTSVDVTMRGGTTTTNMVKSITYNARGQRERIEYSESGGNARFATEYFYDDFTFRLVQVKTIRGVSDLVQDISYTYDAVGNVTTIVDDEQTVVYFNNAVIEPKSEYTYDAIHRLIQASGREHIDLTTQPGFADITYEPQPTDGNRLKTYTEVYEYDPVGNLASIEHLQTATGTREWKREYDYFDGTNRLHRSSRTDDTLGDPTTFGDVYAYDAHGNMVQMPRVTYTAPMVWDAADRLRHVTLGDGTEHEYYVYDSGGNRVRKVYERPTGGTDERLYLGGYETFRHYTDPQSNGTSFVDERQTVHVMDDQARVAMIEAKTRESDVAIGTPVDIYRYQLTNLLGTATVELSETGAVISYEEYHPYGTTSLHSDTGSTTISKKRYRYSGKERDENTGLYYFGARYYAAWLGRWTACDPVFDPIGNPYQYCSSDPVGKVDPDGRKDKEAEDKLPLSIRARDAWNWTMGVLHMKEIDEALRKGVEGLKDASSSVRDAISITLDTIDTLVERSGDIGGTSVGQVYDYVDTTGERSETFLGDSSDPYAIREYRESMSEEDLAEHLLKDRGVYGEGFQGGIRSSAEYGGEKGTEVVTEEGIWVALMALGGGVFGGIRVLNDEAIEALLRKMDDIPWGQYCRSGCEDVAVRIQKAIGGEIHTIVPGAHVPVPPGGLKLGPRDGEHIEWYYHQVVVRGDRVYDALTGPQGMSIDDFKATWEYADDLDFGF